MSASDPSLDRRSASRAGAAFREAERHGLALAVGVRSVIVLAVLVWFGVYSGKSGPAYLYQLGMILVFLFTGLAQVALARWPLGGPAAKYGFIAVDAALLAALLILPNPFAEGPAPSAARGSEFLFFLVLLIQSAFSFAPRFVAWTGICVFVAWSAVLLGATVAMPKWQLEAIIGFLFAGGLALLVRRSRSLVAERAAAERERGNLARYFSPNLVDALAGRDEPFGPVRRQDVAVLYADIAGFTGMAEEMPPEDVLNLLRGFHRRMEAEVFGCGGTLEKFIGDAVLATFGAPVQGAHDAASALACARRMQEAIAAWNAQRAADGRQPLRIGIGLHWGPVVVGDIGSERSMAFTVVGDTVNAANRIQTLTRTLGADVVASDAFLRQVRSVPGDHAGLLAGFADAGEQPLRGHAPLRCHALYLAPRPRASAAD